MMMKTIPDARTIKWCLFWTSCTTVHLHIFFMCFERIFARRFQTWNMWRVTWIKACGGNKVVWAGHSSACVQPHPGQSRTYQRTEWSRCCPCGSSPLPAALDASSGVSAPVVAAPKCAELSSRPPPTSARKKERKRPLHEQLLICSCVRVHSSLSATETRNY